MRVRAAALLDAARRRRRTRAAAIRPAPTTAAPRTWYAAPRLVSPPVLAARLHRHRPGHDRDRAGGARRAADRRELHRARAQGLLQRPQRSTASCRTSSCRTAIRAATAKAGPATRSATRSTSGRTCAAPSAWRSTGPTPAAASSSSRTRRSRTSTRRYTVFGQVVAGMDVVDRLQQWDTITRVRVWDGKTMSGER